MKLYISIIIIALISCNKIQNDSDIENYGKDNTKFYIQMYDSIGEISKVSNALQELKKFISSPIVNTGFSKYYFSFIWTIHITSPVINFIEVYKNQKNELTVNLCYIEMKNKIPFYFNKKENISPLNGWSDFIKMINKLKIYRFKNNSEYFRKRKNWADANGLDFEFSNKFVYKYSFKYFEPEETLFGENDFNAYNLSNYLSKEFKVISKMNEYKTLFLSDSKYPSDGFFRTIPK